MRAWSKIREVEYTRGGNVSYESARGSSASRRAQPFRDLNVSNTSRLGCNTLLFGGLTGRRFAVSSFYENGPFRAVEEPPSLNSVSRARRRKLHLVRGKCALSAARQADSPALLKVSLFRWLGHVVPYWPSARSVHPDNTRRFTNLPHFSATGWSKIRELCLRRCFPVAPTFRRSNIFQHRRVIDPFARFDLAFIRAANLLASLWNRKI